MNNETMKDGTMKEEKMAKKYKHQSHKVIIGIGCLLFVLIFFFDKMLFGGLIHPVRIMFTVILLMIAVRSAYHRFFTGLFFPLAFIYVINYDLIGLERLSHGAALLMAVFLSLGVSMIYSSVSKKQEKNYNEHPERFSEVTVDDAKHIRCTAFFTGISKKVVSEDLKTVEITSSFSGAVIDLTEATVPSGMVSINIVSKLGGTEIYIPKSWNVIDKTQKYLSGITDSEKTRSCCCEPGKDIEIKSENVEVTLAGELKISGVTIIRVTGD